MNVTFIPTDILHIDAGDPVVILGASHIGCVEVVASPRVKSTRDLKGRTVAVATDTKVFISLFAAYVGLDPGRDINWSVRNWDEWPQLLEEGKADAFMTGPPLSVELRQKKFGHVLVSTTYGHTLVTRPPTSRGRSTRVVSSPHTRTSSKGIRWPPSGR